MSLKRCVLILSFLAVYSIGYCQISLRLQPSLGDRLNMHRLAGFYITNSGSDLPSVVALVKVSDKDFQPLFEQRSEPFMVTQGINYLNYDRLVMKSEVFTDPAFSASVSPSGDLPAQPYNICIHLLNEQTGEELASTCELRGMDNNSPPRPVFPENGAGVDSASVLVFSWAPPVPAGSGIRYEFRLVELFPGQSPEEGLISNPVLFEDKQLSAISFSYPAFAPRLEMGRRYAWNIRAYNRDQYLGESEARSFHLTREKPKKEKEKTPCYAILKHKLGSEYYVAHKTLYFTFDNAYRESNPRIRVYDLYMNEITPEGLAIELSEAGGMDRFALHMNKYKVFKDGEKYIFELVNCKNESLKVKCEYRKK